MARNRVELRLLAGILLLVVPILLFGWLFVKQSKKDIAFAEKELLGLAYIEVLAPFLGRSADQGHQVDPKVLQTLKQERAHYDAVLGTRELSTTLVAILEGRVKGDPQKTARELVKQVGDQSNLVLDPDLDSYYMMDVVVMRMPEALQRMNSLSHYRNGLKTGQVPNPQDSAYEILAATQLLTVGEGLQHSLESAFQADATDRLEKNLLASSQALAQEIVRVASALPNASNVGDPRPHVTPQFFFMVENFWKESRVELKWLLERRVSQLKTRLAWALTLAVVVALVALGLAFGVFRFIISRLDDRIIFLAHRDTLTGLLNRTSVTESIHNALESAKQRNGSMAVHLVDLDNFKWINDQHGHQFGDAIIKEIGERLVTKVGKFGEVGRLGGDEFVVLQTKVQSPEEVQRFGQALCESLRPAFVIEDVMVHASGSVGSAIGPSQANTVTNLMKYADLALYRAKAERKDRAVVFEDSLFVEMQARLALEQRVRSATKKGYFKLAFQPIFSSDGSELFGFEALLRLSDTAGQPISPVTFVPVAEQLGLITEIGAWVLKRACETAASWPNHLLVSVNLSAEQFRTPGLSQVIRTALEEAGLEPKRLEVEITESLLLENSKPVLAELKAIRELGVSVAMDDFGTGCSSLSYLLRFPFSKIKIDRSFMQAVHKNDGQSRAVLETIVSLGHKLHMRVTAEGVETQDQAELLQEMNCDEIQGFLFGRPVPETEVAALILSKWRKAHLGSRDSFDSWLASALGKSLNTLPAEKQIAFQQGSGSNTAAIDLEVLQPVISQIVARLAVHSDLIEAQSSRDGNGLNLIMKCNANPSVPVDDSEAAQIDTQGVLARLGCSLATLDNASGVIGFVLRLPAFPHQISRAS